MFCDKCGAQLADTAKFCNKCGNTIKKAEENIKAPVQEVYTDSMTSGKKKQPVRMNKKIMAIVAIVAIVGIVIIAIGEYRPYVESNHMTFICESSDGTAQLKDIDISEFEGGNVVIPSEVRKGLRKYKVTEIAGAFWECNELISVTIPDSVTSINRVAFQDCENLSTIIIPSSVTSIGEYAFNSCGKLANVTISEGVISIGKFAFASCDSLTNITIPKSVKSIGEGAFAGCRNLTSVTILGDDVKVDVDAFEDCSSQLSVTFPD